MSRLSAAALAVLVPLTALAASAPKSKNKLARTAGKVLKSDAKIAPSADGPVFREGRVTIFDKADHTEEFKATPRTKVTLDGKPAKFQRSAVPGALVLKALYNPATKELASLDLKSAPKPDADDYRLPGTVHGEVSNTDALGGVLSVRTADKAVRNYLVSDATRILREEEGKPGAEIRIESLQIGDAVEVHSADGKTALEIHARAAK